MIVDLRAGSPTFLQWFGVELTETITDVVYSQRFAHSFQTLEHQTEVFYQMWTSMRLMQQEVSAGTIHVSGLSWPDSRSIISPESRLCAYQTNICRDQYHLGLGYGYKGLS